MSDATFFSQALGNKTVRVHSSSMNGGERASSTTQSTSMQSRPLLTPDELMQLPKNNAIILCESQPPIRAKKLKS